MTLITPGEYNWRLFKKISGILLFSTVSHFLRWLPSNNICQCMNNKSQFQSFIDYLTPVYILYTIQMVEIMEESLDDEVHNCIFLPQQYKHFTRWPSFRTIIWKMTFRKRKQISENGEIPSNNICVYSDFIYANLLQNSWLISFHQLNSNLNKLKVSAVL